MRQIIVKSLLVGLGVAVAGGALSENLSKDQLAKQFPGISAEQLREAPFPGFYELSVGTQIAYLSADGKYLLRGDAYDLNGNVNITEQHRSAKRAKVLSKVDESEMIIFSPEHPKYTVTVFTDVDCTYCRRLHAQIKQINDLGIRVRYMAYPRTGPGTKSWAKAVSVWCAKDRQSALTHAKLGEPVPQRTCDAAPLVKKEYELGGSLGIEGTPAIYTDTGEQIGGYLPPQALKQQLDRVAAQHAATAG